MNETYAPGVPPKKLTWGFVLSTTYRLYRQHFWPLFRIGMPVGLLTYLYPLVQHAAGKMLVAALLGKTMLRSTVAELPVLMTVVAVITGTIYWLLSTIFFAAIANYLLSSEDEEAGLISDAYSKVRNRVGPLLVVGIVTWVLFSVGRLLAAAAIAILGSAVHLQPGGAFPLAIYLGALLIIAGLVSRLGLAVPELISNSEISVKDAIRDGIRKSENWEPFFMFFLVKSALVGYAVYWLVGYSLQQLWRRSSFPATAYSWTAWAVYICLFAMLESPLFVAFSVLFGNQNSESEEEAAKTAPAIG